METRMENIIEILMENVKETMMELYLFLFVLINLVQTNLPHKWSLLLETMIHQVFSKTELPPLAPASIYPKE